MKKHVIILLIIPIFFLFACSQPNNSTEDQTNTTTEENPNTPTDEQPNSPENPNTPTGEQPNSPENPNTPTGEQPNSPENPNTQNPIYNYYTSEYLIYTMDENGEYYKTYEILYDDPIYTTTSEKISYVTKSYNALGQMTKMGTEESIFQNNEYSTSSITNNFSYSTGQQELISKTYFNSTYNIDNELRWTMNNSYTSRTVSMIDNTETISSNTQTCIKEYIGIVNNKKFFKLYTTNNYNNTTSTSLSEIYLDSDNFVCENINYNPDGSLSSHFIYRHLPNPPQGFNDANIWRIDDISSFDYYDTYDSVCNEIINNENEYKIEIIETYKYKNSQRVYSSKTITNYKKIRIN